MKMFTTIMLMLITLLLGCTPDANITSPDDSVLNPQVQLIKLPALKFGHEIETELTKSKHINGYNGGTFAEQFEFQCVTGNVLINSQLVFPAGAFSEGKTITQTFDTKNGPLDFGPEMQFNIPVMYTLTVSGLDLTGINPETLGFVYVSHDGSITEVEYDSITMDMGTGTLKVTNAKLDHFSRYGFVN